MYLRRNRKQKNGADYDCWTFVESVRTPRGPRQRIVATIGKLPGLDREERIGWDEIGRMLSGKPRLLGVIITGTWQVQDGGNGLAKVIIISNSNSGFSEQDGIFINAAGEIISAELKIYNSNSNSKHYLRWLRRQLLNVLFMYACVASSSPP